MLGFFIEGGFWLIRLLLLTGVFSSLLWFQKYVFKEKHWVWICFVLVGLVNLWLLRPVESYGPDSQMWWALSRGKIDNMGWVLYRPKLYSWFLMLFERDFFVPLAQWGLRVLTLGVVWQLLRVLGCRSVVQALVIVLLGLNSLGVQEQSQLLDTTLFGFLGALTLLAFVQALKSSNLISLFLFGVAAGFCTLSRQLGDPFILLGFLVLFFKGRGSWIQRFLAVALFFVIGWGGLWTNWWRYDVPKRTVALGVNLFTHSSYYDWEKPDDSESELIKKINPNMSDQTSLWNTHYTKDISWFANALPHQYQNYLEEQGMSRLESDKYLTGMYIKWVTENKISFFKSIVNELQRFMMTSQDYYPESLIGRYISLSNFFKRLERLVIHLPIWLLFVVSFVGVFFAREKWLLMILLTSFGYLLLLSSIHLGFTRYVLPLLPFLYLCMGLSLEAVFRQRSFLKKIKIKKKKSITPSLCSINLILEPCIK